jgi:hypothetical protein
MAQRAHQMITIAFELMQPLLALPAGLDAAGDGVKLLIAQIAPAKSEKRFPRRAISLLTPVRHA